MNRLLFNLFLPRGGQYTHHPALCSDWQEAVTPVRKISLLYRFAANPSRKTVILAHPYVSAAKLFFLDKGIADVYLHAGINVVVFDFNGFGQSDFKDFDFYLDIGEVYTMAQEIFHGTQVILHGVSFGAAQSVIFMSQQGQIPLQLVLESCPADRADYFRKRKKFLYYILRLVGVASRSFSRSGNYLKSAAGIHMGVNVTLLYGSDDQLTPVTTGMAYEEVLRNRSQLIVCSGGHIDMLQKDYISYKKALLSPLQVELE